MNTVGAILREIAALFIDDEWLAFAILALVALCAGLAFGLPGHPTGGAAALTVGSILVLAFSVRQGSRRKPR